MPTRSPRTRRRCSPSSQTVSQTRFDTGQLRAATAAQKKVLDASLADLKKAKARLKKLEAQTARQLALQRTAYQGSP